jgi:hypothetical protein
MLKRLFRKILGSIMHSRHSHRRHSSSHRNYGRRRSSDHYSGYGHKNQGHGYYKNKYRSSSS